MSRTSAQLRSMNTNAPTSTRVSSYTVAQASVLTGVPQKQVHQYLDRELSFLMTVGAGFRAVRKDGLVWLRMNHELTGALTAKFRLEVINKVMENPRIKSVTIGDGPLTVRTDTARTTVAGGLAKWRECKDLIACDDDVLGGEPCVKGTRLSVYTLNELFKACGQDEVFNTYPDVTKRELDAAVMYADMYPRKGRPRSVGARLDKAKPKRSRSISVKLPR